eukprot:91156_1
MDCDEKLDIAMINQIRINKGIGQFMQELLSGSYPIRVLFIGSPIRVVFFTIAVFADKYYGCIQSSSEHLHIISNLYSKHAAAFVKNIIFVRVMHKMYHKSKCIYCKMSFIRGK